MGCNCGKKRTNLGETSNASAARTEDAALIAAAQAEKNRTSVSQAAQNASSK